MNKINYWVLCAVAACTFISCNSGEIEKLEARIAELEQELDHCQNGESVIVGTMKNALLNGNKEEYMSLYTKLKEEFPSSGYLAEAKIKNDEIEEAIQLQKNKELESKLKSLNNLKKTFDDVSGITWYKQKYFTHYDNRNLASITVGKRKSSEPWINLKMSYTGSSWIFFEDAYLSFDGETRRVPFDRYTHYKSDNGAGGVWEWIQVTIDEEFAIWLSEFIKHPEAKMRLSGKYTETRTLTANEKKGIEDVLNAYWFLKENPDVD